MLQVTTIRQPALAGNALPDPAVDSTPSPREDGEFDAVLSGLGGPVQPDEGMPPGDAQEVETPPPTLSLDARMDPTPPVPLIVQEPRFAIDVCSADLPGQRVAMPAPSGTTEAMPPPAEGDQQDGKRDEERTADSTPANPSQMPANGVEVAPSAPAAVASVPADTQPVSADGSTSPRPLAAKIDAGSLAGRTVDQTPAVAQAQAEQASFPAPVELAAGTVSSADTQRTAPHRQARQTAVSSDLDPAFPDATEVSTADDAATAAFAMGQGDEVSWVKGRPDAAMPQRTGHFILQTALPATPGALGPEIARIARGAPGDPVDIQLAPQELGRLRIRVWTESDTPRVSVQAERPETLELLRRHGDVLVKELRAAGFEGGTLDFAGWSGGDGRSTPFPIQPAMGLDGDFVVGPAGVLAASEPLRLETGLNLRL